MTNNDGSSTAANWASPSPIQRPISSKQCSAPTSPRCAAAVTISPEIPSGSPPASASSPAAKAGEWRAISRASVTSARPEPYCSQHPCSPHPQRRP